jgi:hypothetical protein
MLKIRGNKEFIQWWEHWMSRIHSNRHGVATTSAERPTRETEKKKREDEGSETQSPRNPNTMRPSSETP